MSLTQPFKGILPAMQVPFNSDFSIDEQELRHFATWLAGHDGIGGLVTNGHTGEVFALSPRERAEVTRIVAEEVAGKLPVISGINCESINEAVEHAQMAKEAGASGHLVMPPHIWLRFGMRPEHVLRYFSAIGEAVEINLVVHIYPAWINPLKDVVYSKGEPSSEAHARMKIAMNLSGRTKSTTVRPPIDIPSGEAYLAIENAVKKAGLMK